MVAMIVDQVSAEGGAAAEAAVPAGVPAERAGRLPGGAVARLLARVSRWTGEYADYQMEAGVWRKLSL